MEKILALIIFGLIFYMLYQIIVSIRELFKALQSVMRIREVENKLRYLLEENGMDPEEFNHQLDKLLKELEEIE